MVREWVKRHFGLFDIKDLQAGAHCGCCGAWVEGEIVPRYWAWSVCQKCQEAPE